ncbi:MAG: histidine--tRNA ligase [Saccharofermentanales bacterium]
MKTSTVKGTNDYLPKEAALREFIQNKILETYQSNGFDRIITPAIEDIENLDKSDGGDNLNLIFKIMKRGDKLSAAIQNLKFDELADLGLRYDLTLPLSRYYANNRQNLMLPMKCIQIDKVYRAERPQRGRLRELIQCDIDIIGSDSIYCEVELINVTAKALMAIGLKNFKVKINDRNILKDILIAIGFKQDDLNSVCITFDKLNKTGVEGVKNELYDKCFCTESIEKLVSVLNNLPLSIDYVKSICTKTDSIKNLKMIISEVSILAEDKYTIEFDLSLVRGQGYYTGTVFEIESTDFNDSIAGGGRYDNLVGKFTKENIPAVGFSIGFERIYCILTENNYKIPNRKKKVAILFENDFIQANKQAELLRQDYDVTLYEKPKKMGKFLSNLQKNGYYGFYICGQSEVVNVYM